MYLLVLVVEKKVSMLYNILNVYKNRSRSVMSFLGKLHEISLYGLISNIFCLSTGRITFSSLFESAFNPNNFAMFFQCYMFWASVLFIPIVIIGAFATKYGDGGKGLTFKSDNLVVIAFAHIAEEVLGLILTPFWFLKDWFTKKLDDGWKVFDYVTYAVELIFILIGVFIIL